MFSRLNPTCFESQLFEGSDLNWCNKVQLVITTSDLNWCNSDPSWCRKV